MLKPTHQNVFSPTAFFSPPSPFTTNTLCHSPVLYVALYLQPYLVCHISLIDLLLTHVYNTFVVCFLLSGHASVQRQELKLKDDLNLFGRVVIFNVAQTFTDPHPAILPIPLPPCLASLKYYECSVTKTYCHDLIAQLLQTFEIVPYSKTVQLFKTLKI